MKKAIILIVGLSAFIVAFKQLNIDFAWELIKTIAEITWLILKSIFSFMKSILEIVV
jgi:hypothetical protein